jgi:Spy/CpxP family protein refolding chaperone
MEIAAMKYMIRTVLSLGLVALIAAPAAAQGRGFGRGGGGSYSMLLGNASVQKELKLDDQQIEKAKALSEKVMAEIREKTEGLEGQERFQKMRELMPEINASTIKSAGDFLKAEQVTRLKQIRHQAMGAMAFSDPEIAQKLNLTDGQKTEIREIGEAAREKFQGLQGLEGEERMAKMREINKETLSQVVAKLNDEQQKTWKELTGAPFEIKYEPRPNN